MFLLYIVPVSFSVLTHEQDTQSSETSDIIKGLILMFLVGYVLIISFAFIYFRKPKLHNIIIVAILSVILVFVTMNLEIYNTHIYDLFSSAFSKESFLVGSLGTIFYAIPMFLSGSIAMYLVKKK